MADKAIRGGELTIGTAVLGVKKLSWKDAPGVDRSASDTRFYGEPITMSKAGSGSVDLKADGIATGIQTADWVYKYNKVAVTAGVESVVQATVTFKNVDVKAGGDVPAAAAGSRSADFDYSEAIES